jgi:cbb3-type cytochrome oxidase subunit 3
VTVFRSLITVTLFVAFLLLWYWTWRTERHEAFAAAARLPLEDEHGVPRRAGSESS